MEVTLRQRVVPVVWLPGLVLYAGCGIRGAEYAVRNGLKLVAQVEPSDFHWAVRRIWGRKLLRQATHGLLNTYPDFSARCRITPAQILAFLLLVGCFAASLALLPLTAVWAFANAVVGLFFLSIVALRLFSVLPLGPVRKPHVLSLSDAELPIYSVLVPVFRETAVLKQLLRALLNLRYPVNKLDIKIIVEEADTTMRRALERFDLPPHFEIIVVPQGKPQTKPRALNYALQFSRGTLLTIYDAEDIPEPNQLRVAAQRFSQADRKLACVQAQLVFFNSNENWLTRQFTAEYATLFGLILPALAAYGLPLPLGGTSNHFRTDILRRVGGWDPHNVTEDADLGLRLARFGFHTAIIESLTYEEANTQFFNWMKQRARWLKGFMQTWLVHVRDPVKMTRDLGPAGFWVLQTCTAGIFVSALFHPLLLVFMLGEFILDPLPSADETFLRSVLEALNLLVFATGYGVAIVAANLGLQRRGFRGWWLTLFTMPVYWLLMSGAAWIAVWQFSFSPFTWNKTEHGLTKIKVN